MVKQVINPNNQNKTQIRNSQYKRFLISLDNLSNSQNLNHNKINLFKENQIIQRLLISNNQLLNNNSMLIQ